MIRLDDPNDRAARRLVAYIAHRDPATGRPSGACKVQTALAGFVMASRTSANLPPPRKVW
jgi:hypothetical protein